VFLLVICITGLPLVFAEEINNWLEPHTYAQLPANTPAVDVDRLTQTARKRFPGEIISSIFLDDEEPQIVVSLAPSRAAIEADPKQEHFIRFDSRTGAVLGEILLGRGGIWWGLSWLSLAAPLAAIVWFVMPRTRAGPP